MAGVDILASAFSGANAAFLGDQYARWATNPASVDPSFAELFGAMNDEARAVIEDATGASWAPRQPETPATAIGSANGSFGEYTRCLTRLFCESVSQFSSRSFQSRNFAN